MHQIPDIRSVVCGHVFLGSPVSFSLLVPRALPTAPPTFLSLVVLQGMENWVHRSLGTRRVSVSLPSSPHLPLSFLFALSPSPSPLLRRLLYPPGILCIFGSAVGLLECACGSESLLHTSDDEHVIRLSQDSQYLWSLWEVSER